MMGQLGKKKQIEAGTARAQKVRDITDRLIAQAIKLRPDSAGWKWEVQVINDPKTVNAFCMAGGKMAIYTGMWDKLQRQRRRDRAGDGPRDQPRARRTTRRSACRWR